MNTNELERLIQKTMSKSLSAYAKPRSVFSPILAAEDNENEPGIKTARIAKCLLLSKNDAEKALRLASGGSNSSSGMYPNDKGVHEQLKALSATTPSEGGFLINEEMAADMIPLLYSAVAVTNLGARRIPMKSGNLNMPKMTNGSTSYYQGESQDATISQQVYGNIHMSSKKLITLVPISNDLIRSSSLSADKFVRDDMVQQMRMKMDYTALYGQGTVYVPTGLKYMGITTGTSTAVITADDVGNIVGILMSSNAPMLSPGWAFNGLMWSTLYNLKTTTNAYIYRDEMNRGTLNGFPFRVTNQITTDTANVTALFFGDWSEFLFGEQLAFEMMASQEASYKDASGNLVSAFSLDQTVLKVTNLHDFAVRHADVFQMKEYPYA